MPTYPQETYNGHVARYKTDASGNVVGFIKPNSNDEIAPVAVFGQPNNNVSPGIEVFAFGTGTPTSTATQSSCTATKNATGWTDGSPCLDIVPNADSFCEYRMYFDAASAIDLNDDDGFAVEFLIPDMTGKNSPSLSIEVSSTATSTSTPTDRTGWKIYQGDSSPCTYHGKHYQRIRFDIAATDAKFGLYDGSAPSVGGAGYSKVNKANWMRFTFNTNMGGKTIKLKRLVRGGRARPTLIIGTDSAAFHPIGHLLGAYFAAKGWGGYINQYVGGGTGWQNTKKSQDTMNLLYGSGWDINLNDVVDRALGATVTDQATMAAAVAGAKSAQLAMGWERGANIWIANNNDYSDLMIQELQAAGVVCNRAGATEGRYVFCEGGIANPYRLPSVGVDQKTTAQITPMIDRCNEYGATMWMYFHNVFARQRVIDDGQTDPASNTPSAYAGINPSYCAARGIDQYCIWWEELKGALDYVSTTYPYMRVITPSQWAQENLLA